MKCQSLLSGENKKTISKYNLLNILSSMLSINLLPSILISGLSFYSFETLKAFCLSSFPNTLGRPCPKNTGGLVLITPAKLLCGGVAGAVAQSLV